MPQLGSSPMEPESERRIERRRAQSYDGAHSGSSQHSHPRSRLLPPRVVGTLGLGDVEKEGVRAASEELGAIEELCLCEKGGFDSSTRPEEGEILPLRSSPKKPGTLKTAWSEEEACFICMGRFTKRNPAVPLPCSEACNSAPVHAKCIYEWGERQKNISSCPLCRSKLGEVDYTPPDLLRSQQLVMFGCRKAFITLPLPRRVGIVRCFIIAEQVGRKGLRKTIWKCYLQAPPKLRYPSGPRPDADSPKEDDRLLLVARKRGTLRKRIDITLDEHGRDFRKQSVQYVGSLLSSPLGLEHTIVAPFRETNATRKSSQKAYIQLGFVRYTQNRIGRAVGPRRMEIALPNVSRPSYQENSPPVYYHEAVSSSSSLSFDSTEDSDDDTSCESQSVDDSKKWTTKVHRPANRTQTLRSLLARGAEAMINDKTIIYGSNVEPYWLEQIGAYSLDFQGRVTLPSNKNFQLVAGNRTNDIILQFGKVTSLKNKEIYTMDVQWPLSPLQAFGICLSACDRKLACA